LDIKIDKCATDQATGHPAYIYMYLRLLEKLYVTKVYYRKSHRGYISTRNSRLESARD